MITPKKFKLSTHSICIPLILAIGDYFFCGFLIIMNFDLAELNDNLFISTKYLFPLILYSFFY